MRNDSSPGWLQVCARLVVASLAAWAVLAVAEIALLFAVLPMIAFAAGPDLLPSLKVVLDMGVLVGCGWVAGRIASPRPMAAAALAAAGLMAFDLTPYLVLNFPWLLRLIVNAFRESRYLSSLLSTLTLHALMLGSLVFGAHLSRPRRGPVGLGKFD